MDLSKKTSPSEENRSSESLTVTCFEVCRAVLIYFRCNLGGVSKSGWRFHSLNIMRYCCKCNVAMQRLFWQAVDQVANFVWTVFLHFALLVLGDAKRYAVFQRLPVFQRWAVEITFGDRYVQFFSSHIPIIYTICSTFPIKIKNNVFSY